MSPRRRNWGIPKFRKPLRTTALIRASALHRLESGDNAPFGRVVVWPRGAIFGDMVWKIPNSSLTGRVLVAISYFRPLNEHTRYSMYRRCNTRALGGGIRKAPSEFGSSSDHIPRTPISPTCVGGGPLVETIPHFYHSRETHSHV